MYPKDAPEGNAYAVMPRTMRPSMTAHTVSSGAAMRQSRRTAWMATEAAMARRGLSHLGTRRMEEMFISFSPTLGLPSTSPVSGAWRGSGVDGCQAPAVGA